MLFWVLTLTVFTNFHIGVDSDPLPVVVTGYTYAPGIGYHKVHSQAATRAKARSICKEEGGDLTIINSVQELEIIQQLLTLSFPHMGSTSSNYVIIGLNNCTIEYQNETVEATLVGTERHPNEPNDERGTKDCGFLHENGQLNYIGCNDTFAFVCERPKELEAPHFSLTLDSPWTEELATALRPRRRRGSGSCSCSDSSSSGGRWSTGSSSSSRSSSRSSSYNNPNYYYLNIYILAIVLNKLHVI